VATLQDLRERLAEMTEVGEAVCVDGLATRVQRPGGWANQKVLDDAKRRTHAAQGVALSTIHGDLLWCDGGWPASCHEHELLEVSGVRAVLDATGVTALVDRGFRGTAKVRALARADRGPTHQKASARRPNATTTASRPGCAPWWSRRSGIWPTPGRCGAGVACCTGSGTSTGPPPRSSASADGSTASRHERSIRTPSLTNWSTML
jgi:DDE superfamily endonuclease